jgi:hypothetical protein
VHENRLRMKLLGNISIIFACVMDIGAGASLTGISIPDLGGSFQFNLQAGAGLNWFVRDNLAVSLECRFLHRSSSAIYMPNNGVNTLGGLIGLNQFF